MPPVPDHYIVEVKRSTHVFGGKFDRAEAGVIRWHNVIAYRVIESVTESANDIQVAGDHYRKLKSTAPQLLQERIQFHSFWNAQHVFFQRGHRHFVALCARHRDCLLQVHHALNVVLILVVNGKPGKAGLCGTLQHGSGSRSAASRPGFPG